MHRMPQLGEWLAHHRARINIGTLIVFGIWAGWMAWLTRPAEDIAPATSVMPAAPTSCWIHV